MHFSNSFSSTTLPNCHLFNARTLLHRRPPWIPTATYSRDMLSQSGKLGRDTGLLPDFYESSVANAFIAASWHIPMGGRVGFEPTFSGTTIQRFRPTKLSTTCNPFSFNSPLTTRGLKPIGFMPDAVLASLPLLNTYLYHEWQ